ncbi:MAG TPA: ATP-binding protein, partial [Polyangiaceae bacterium]
EDDTQLLSLDGISGVRPPRAPTRTDTVWLDEVTAGLLGAEFSVEVGAAGLELTGERPAKDTQVRTLLGKPTPCVGRERELEQLDALLAQAESDSVARAVLVTAPAGVGKSRVRYEWLDRVASRDPPVQIWSCRADPMSAGSPLRHAHAAAAAGGGHRSVRAARDEPRAPARAPVAPPPRR